MKRFAKTSGSAKIRRAASLFKGLAVKPPVDPMLAKSADEIPEGPEWRYEPKWDGFRAMVFRDGDELLIDSRNHQPLQRYFPELMAPLKAALPERCVIDGEIVISGKATLDFDALLQRIHPAQSRIDKLSTETPAQFVAFDLLARGKDNCCSLPLIQRRQLLIQSIDSKSGSLFLTPHTPVLALARQWFIEYEGAGMDGIVAKHQNAPYLPGERAMVKIKHQRTADCVVGGYRLHKDGEGVGSLLLGLYDGHGILHHVGHTSSFTRAGRGALLIKLRPLEGGVSFGEGRTPGGPNRWSQGRDSSWIALSPQLVCEVRFDHLQGNRFRHAATFARYRPDKKPRECTYDQLAPPHPFVLEDLLKRFS